MDKKAVPDNPELGIDSLLMEEPQRPTGGPDNGLDSIFDEDLPRQPIPRSKTQAKPVARPVRQPEQLQEAGSASMPICPRCGGKLATIHRTVKSGYVLLTCPLCYCLLNVFPK